MRSRRHVAVAAVALAAGALLVGCGDKTDKLTASDGPIASGNGITPEKLTANQGHKVRIMVTNTAKDKEHGFSIDAFNVHETITQGRTTTVKFKADKAGTFRVYCQIHPTHKPAELTVS